MEASDDAGRTTPLPAKGSRERSLPPKRAKTSSPSKDSGLRRGGSGSSGGRPSSFRLAASRSRRMVVGEATDEAGNLGVKSASFCRKMAQSTMRGKCETCTRTLKYSSVRSHSSFSDGVVWMAARVVSEAWSRATVSGYWSGIGGRGCWCSSGLRSNSWM